MWQNLPYIAAPAAKERNHLDSQGDHLAGNVILAHRGNAVGHDEPKQQHACKSNCGCNNTDMCSKFSAYKKFHKHP